MRIVALLSLILAMVGCEGRTTVNLAGGNPPSFMLRGSGRLLSLMIYDPIEGSLTTYDPNQAASSNNADRKGVMWEIAAVAGWGEKVERLSAIAYGVVPSGYKQLRPENDRTPPALQPEKIYKYWFETVDAPHARGCFEIHDGKAIAAECPQ